MSLKVTLLAAIKREPTAIDHLGLLQGLQQLGCQYLIWDLFEDNTQEMLNKLLMFKPDVVIHYLMRSLLYKFPEQIHNLMKTKQVAWFLDYRPDNYYRTVAKEELEAYKTQAQYLDLLFVSSKGQIPFWTQELQIKTYYLPHGCYIPKTLEYDKQFRYPCVFIGGMYSDELFQPRKRLIEEIRELTPVTIINAPSLGPKRNKIWSLMPKIYFSSDAVLDISHFWKVDGYCSGRFFYSSGLGGATVTKRFPGCEKLFPPGVKLYFNTIKEAVDHVQWLQKHPQEREEIKRKAFLWSKKHHSMKDRFSKIFKELGI